MAGTYSKAQRDSIIVNLSSLMQKKNMTQAKLSTLSGVTQTTISFILNGKTNPRVDTINLLAEALDVTHKDLVKERAFLPVIQEGLSLKEKEDNELELNMPKEKYNKYVDICKEILWDSKDKDLFFGKAVKDALYKTALKFDVSPGSIIKNLAYRKDDEEPSEMNAMFIALFARCCHLT